MNFADIINLVFKYVKAYERNNTFQLASEETENLVVALPKSDFLNLVEQMGIIPEKIVHDSKEEKLFTKVAEIVLARCFREIGLKATLYSTRGNTADIYAQSVYHNYSLVADAKTFRLSRTAKNQKDFKVESMAIWRKDNDYAVLCCPYFQYPKSKSTIFKQAIDVNVSLFTWEYFHLLISHGIKESLEVNLSKLWGYSRVLAQNIRYTSLNSNFLDRQNKFIVKAVNLPSLVINQMLARAKESTIARSKMELAYLHGKLQEIEDYSREQAIVELISALKINEKINAIDAYINRIGGAPI
ncbi:MAG: HindIII family type II restriction endonuclease [Selenomonadaceae bacterium]|nr:HindIII family type II restriction endonuclease [Selenomonadaceae bacterium]